MKYRGPGTESPLINHEVTVGGRVTANFDGTFYLQNGNTHGNGICVYNALQTGKIGDSIVVTGIVTEYSTLTELGNISYMYNFDDQHFIEPIEISVSEISEDYEGMLVKISNVEFAKQGQYIENNNLTYSFSNEEGSGIIFSRHDSRLGGNKLPIGKIDLIGIVSQYNNEYQILPRGINDFALITRNKEIAFHSDFSEIYPNPASSVLKIKSNREILGIKI